MRKFVLYLGLLTMQISYSLPSGFVYLSDVAPDIQQDMRYATNNNFVGRSISGYVIGTCILTKQAAEALKLAQKIAKEQGYSLKVYDCYRPQRSVDDFYRWSTQKQTSLFNPDYYPRVKKDKLFQKGYIARYSGHSRGSTVDLTLISKRTQNKEKQPNSTKLCYSSSADYLDDNSINMGTRFDCLDPSAHYRNKSRSKIQFENRSLLRRIMQRAGFKPYHKEWWHFSLINEPFPKNYFNFLVR